MKILSFLISLIIFCFISFSHAEYGEYLRTLKMINFPLQDILNQKAITRYDLTKVLNLSDCFNCEFPSIKEKKLLNTVWWSVFKKDIGNYFDDIYYESSFFKGKDYYYCVSYAANHDYINGYPKTSSPFCPGKFCGSKYTSIAEFLQVYFNILANYIYKDYSANWEEVKTWMNTLDTESYTYKYFDLNDFKNINLGFNKCANTICKFNSASEFNTRVKYCTFNVNNCKFTNFENIREGKWPIAEINILYKETIMDYNTVNKLNLDDPIDGDFVLKYLYELTKKNNCQFDDDFDKDGIKNRNDNCIYTYNPHQRDTDKDKIGDVCDPDIDNDKIPNPIGIVDDNGRINIKSSLDKKNNNIKRSFIEPEKLNILVEEKDKLKIKYGNFTKEDVKEIKWVFGDGQTGYGEEVIHYYLKSGNYPVQANILLKNDENLENMVIIGVSATDPKNKNEIRRSNIISDKTELEIGEKANLELKYGNFPESLVKEIIWNFGDNNSGKGKNTSHAYTKEGKYPVEAKLYLKNNEILINSIVISIHKKNSPPSDLPPTSEIKADKYYGNIGDPFNFEIIYKNILPDNIKYIKWNFSDGTYATGNIINHTFPQPGKYPVQADIVFKNGTILENKIVIGVTILENKIVIGVTIPDNNINSRLFAEKYILKTKEKTKMRVNYNGIKENEIVSINWKFEDNKTDKGKSLFHAYDLPGTYQVTATIQLKNGQNLNNEIVISVLPDDAPQLDNCIFINNSDQKDENQDNIGDACSNKKTSDLGLYISCNPLTGKKPLKTNCQANTIGNIEKINRNFGDNKFGSSKNLPHTYDNIGQYTVQATAQGPNNQTLIAQLIINVYDNNITNNQAFEIKCNPLVGNAPLKTTCNSNYQGDVVKVDRIADNSTKTLNIDDKFIKIFPNPGIFPIIGKGYDSQGKYIGESKLNISVSEDKNDYYNKIGSNLTTDKLTLKVGEQVNFTTLIQGFNINDIANIEWNFGDNQTTTNQELKMSKIYTIPGIKNVIQTIYLKNEKILENKLQINVIQDQNKPDNIGPASYLKAIPLIQNLGKPINFDLITQNINPQNSKMLTWDMGDGTILKYSEKINEYFKEKYTYNKSGTYTVKAIIYLSNGGSLINEATITVIGDDICQEDLSKFKCDMDKDGIPDICDNDIDGDNINNLIGIIKFETANCSLTGGNIDKKLEKEEHDIALKGGDIDNCPFKSNNDQIDTNSNGYGDKCDTTDTNCNLDGLCQANENCSCGDCSTQPICTCNNDSICSDKEDCNCRDCQNDTKCYFSKKTGKCITDNICTLDEECVCADCINDIKCQIPSIPPSNPNCKGDKCTPPIIPVSICNFNNKCESKEDCKCADCKKDTKCYWGGGDEKNCNNNGDCEKNEECSCADCKIDAKCPYTASKLNNQIYQSSSLGGGGKGGAGDGNNTNLKNNTQVQGR